MFKYLIINIITTLISVMTIIYFVQFHSTHPQHGNTQLVSQKFRCNPWDNCNAINL